MFGKNTGARQVLRHLPGDSIGVEIGVWKGLSSEVFLEKAAHLHMVDPWSPAAYLESDEFGSFDDYLDRYSVLTGGSDEASFQHYYDKIYASVAARFADLPVTIHRMTSSEFFKNFDGLADWFYIDGLHSFSGCLADLRGASKICRYAIFGDDYGVKPGVTQAVDKFIEETGLMLERFGADQYLIRICN